MRRFMLLAGLAWAYLEVTQREMDACVGLELEMGCVEFFTSDVVEVEGRRKMLEEAQQRMQGQNGVEKNAEIVSAFLDRREVEYVFAFLQVDMANFLVHRMTSRVSAVDLLQMLKHARSQMNTIMGGPFFTRGERKAEKLLLHDGNRLFDMYRPLAVSIMDKRVKVFEAIETCDAQKLEAAVQGLDVNFESFLDRDYGTTPLEKVVSTCCHNGIILTETLLLHGAYPSKELRQSLATRSKPFFQCMKRTLKEKKIIQRMILQTKTPDFLPPFRNAYRVPPSVRQGAKLKRRSRMPSITSDIISEGGWQTSVV